MPELDQAHNAEWALRQRDNPTLASWTGRQRDQNRLGRRVSAIDISCRCRARPSRPLASPLGLIPAPRLCHPTAADGLPPSPVTHAFFLPPMHYTVQHGMIGKHRINTCMDTACTNGYKALLCSRAPRLQRDGPSYAAVWAWAARPALDVAAQHRQATPQPQPSSQLQLSSWPLKREQGSHRSPLGRGQHEQSLEQAQPSAQSQPLLHFGHSANLPMVAAGRCTMLGKGMQRSQGRRLRARCQGSARCTPAGRWGFGPNQSSSLFLE